MASGKVRVAIVGALGYGGVGATELLIKHPGVELVRLINNSEVGRPVSAIYPHLAGHCDLVLQPLDDPAIYEGVDIVLYSTPDGVGQAQAREWVKRGVKVIDYSGDFRFQDADVYAGYASRIGKPTEHQSPELLGQSVYGVAELHRDRIRGARIVGNPGCFAIATILGLAAAVKSGLVNPHSIICDCKSGVSGAGKKPTPGFHYPARYEATNAYKVSGHQHVYEVERELSALAGTDLKVTFTPHVVPMTRGIVATLYADLVAGATGEQLLEVYRAFYKGERFVRVLPPGGSPSSTDVRGSNYCNIWVNADPRTGKAILVSHIDNLMKGQASNAVQNLNLMTGLDEGMGLAFAGQYP